MDGSGVLGREGSRSRVMLGLVFVRCDRGDGEGEVGIVDGWFHLKRREKRRPIPRGFSGVGGDEESDRFGEVGEEDSGAVGGGERGISLVER